MTVKVMFRLILHPAFRLRMIGKSFRRACLVLSGGLLLASRGLARDLFTFDISAGNAPVVSRGVNDIRDFLHLFDNSSLREIFPGYDPSQGVVALVDARGIQGILEYLPNSSELRLALPQLGLDVRFPGGSRDASQHMLEQWLKGLLEIKDFATRAELRQLLQAVVKYSPVEPMAGNPNSLQSRMFMTDFSRAIHSPRVQLSGLPPDAQKPAGVFQVGLDYGADYRADAFDVHTLSLSLAGVINFPNRHWSILIDGPLMGTWTEGSESVLTYPGVGLQYRVTDWWDLTAFVRAGIVGSIKLGSVGGFYSGTLTSYLHKDFGNISVGWGLMGGFSQSIDGIEIDHYNLTYGLLNYPLQTGVDASGPLGFTLGTKSANWSLFANYAHIFGTDLFLQDFYEVGAGFILKTEVRNTRIEWMRCQVSYLFGEDYHGISTSLTFNF